MTRPIYEPNTQRALAAQKYGQNQLFRRPAPQGGGSLAYCYMRWVGSEAVPVDTLSNPATVGSPDVPYEESFVYDPDNTAGFNPDRSSGCITWDFPGEYFIQASVEWNGGATPGSILGGVLDRGRSCSFATNRTTNMIIANGINEGMWIPFTDVIFSFNPDSFGTDSVKVLCYHDDAGGQSIARVDIHIIQLNVNVDGVFDP